MKIAFLLFLLKVTCVLYRCKLELLNNLHICLCMVQMWMWILIALVRMWKQMSMWRFYLQHPWMRIPMRKSCIFSAALQEICKNLWIFNYTWIFTYSWILCETGILEDLLLEIQPYPRTSPLPYDRLLYKLYKKDISPLSWNQTSLPIGSPGKKC